MLCEFMAADALAIGSVPTCVERNGIISALNFEFKVFRFVMGAIYLFIVKPVIIKNF